ncbi:hypothetical protein AAF712_005453 [Marasmius tenuissimus]|uniref:Uncharacterized protein n=1 Tax=Marasmius tenuissimus TaxID=585030 RepID=A0ABR3A1L7_9AGAR
MPSLSVAAPNIVEPVVPNVHRDDDAPSDVPAVVVTNQDESAVDMEPMEMPARPPKAKGRSVYGSSLVERRGSEAAYELHQVPTLLSERPRRPSAMRQDSAEDTLIELRGLGKTVEDETPVATPRTEVPSTSSLVNHDQTQDQEVQQTKKQKRRAMMHLAALYYCFFLEGWNDGTLGPLLPVIQRDYQASFHDLREFS